MPIDRKKPVIIKETVEEQARKDYEYGQLLACKICKKRPRDPNSEGGKYCFVCDGY